MNDHPVSGPDAPAPCDEDAGPRAAFDAALIEHRAELHTYLLRRLQGDSETAADLTQETLSRAMKYRDVAGIEDRRLMLFRIANNLIIEFHRSQHRHQAGRHIPLADAGPLRAEEPPVETLVDARRAIDVLVKRTLLTLPPRCALAFMLNRFDGLTYPQVATQMNISVKMVEKHIARALVACREAVGDRDF